MMNDYVYLSFINYYDGCFVLTCEHGCHDGCSVLTCEHGCHDGCFVLTCEHGCHDGCSVLMCEHDSVLMCEHGCSLLIIICSLHYVMVVAYSLLH